MRTDLGLLLLRLSFGGTMLLSHGLPKLLGYSEKVATFADPIGIGIQTSLVLAIMAEVFCSLALVVGLFTRLSTIPLMFTMLVAFLIVHGQDPWGKKELSFVYFCGFLAIALLGPGRLSLDAVKNKILPKKK